MEAPAHLTQVRTASKRFIRRLLTIGENRLELLMVEVQEERERLLRAIVLALGVAAFGLLSGVALTGLVVTLFWHISPVAVLLGVTVAYGLVALFLFRKLKDVLKSWENFPATIDQLRKDRTCLEKILS